MAFLWILTDPMYFSVFYMFRGFSVSMDPKSFPIHLSDLIGSYVFETFVDFFAITRITKQKTWYYNRP